MTRIVSLRAINRSAKIRVRNSGGSLVRLRVDQDTLVDLDTLENQHALGHHSAIGQYNVLPDSGAGSSGFTVTTATAGIPLAAGATFSQWFDTGSSTGCLVAATGRSDVSGTLSFEDSSAGSLPSPGTSGQALDSVTATQRGSLYISSARVLTTRRYVRVVYVNGGSPQTSLDLSWATIK